MRTIWSRTWLSATALCTALFAGLANAANPVTPVDPAVCISIANTCVTVPVQLSRTDATGLRGYSIDLQLSSNLALCAGTSSITEGTYLSGTGTTVFHVIDNGTGSYTVDAAILGLPCGANAASGTLFSLAIKKNGPDGIGTVTVTGTTLRDCSNGSVPSEPGAPASITIDTVAPGAIALTTAQATTGNDTDGTTKISVSVPAVDTSDVVRVYRKGYGNYPEYDDAPGAGNAPTVPVTETAALATGWVLATSLAGPGPHVVFDEAITRDFWYYVAFVEDACGNVGNATSITSGTLNYHLGDVHDGSANCNGNNLVNTSDLSYLGANYGVTLVASDPRGCLDVGPTTNFSVNARPTTDDRIQFEDLILFAINHGTVSKSRLPAAPSVRIDELSVLVPAGGREAGDQIAAHLWLQGSGSLQGVSARLSWDPAVVQPVATETGELLAQQGGLALTPAPGTVDAVLLGVSRSGLGGEGTLATVTFRVLSGGDPRIAVVTADGRDAHNQRVAVTLAGTGSGSGTAAPRLTALLPNVPNPFNPTTRLSFTLASAGHVRLAIFDAAGREIRVLADGMRGAGLHEVQWEGQATNGRTVPSGVYYARLAAAGAVYSRPLTLLK